MSEAPERIKARFRAYDDETYSISAYLPVTPTELPDGSDGHVEYIRTDIHATEIERLEALTMAAFMEGHAAGYSTGGEMSEAPERIWLTYDGWWLPEPSTERDAPYIRADIHATEIERLRSAVSAAWHMLATGFNDEAFDALDAALEAKPL